jgi:hypothetical protein
LLLGNNDGRLVLTLVWLGSGGWLLHQCAPSTAAPKP